jgi:hypothetical protein
MSTATRNRWLNWKPKGQIVAETAESEPTKTSKTNFVVFDGSLSANSPEIGVPGLECKRQEQIFSNSPEMAPTKTSKMPESEPNGVFDVFDGSSPAKSPKIEGVPDATLKGQAIELWCDRTGGRVFIVADEEDAQEAMGRFSAGRGEVWTPGEIELVTRIGDQAIRDEMAAFKRKLDGALSPAPPVSRARTTAATIRHFERKAGRAR